MDEGHRPPDPSDYSASDGVGLLRLKALQCAAVGCWLHCHSTLQLSRREARSAFRRGRGVRRGRRGEFGEEPRGVPNARSAGVPLRGFVSPKRSNLRTTVYSDEERIGAEPMNESDQCEDRLGSTDAS